MTTWANIAHTPAPQFAGFDSKDKVGRGLMITSIASPVKALTEIHNFLHEGDVPAEIREPVANTPWIVQAAAFIDNIQVDLEVHVFGNEQESETSTIVFHHEGHNDTVRFHRLIAGFQKHAISCGICTGDPSMSSSLPGNCVLEDFDDFDDFECETDSQERVEALVAQLEGFREDARLEAVQLLACWAEKEPEVRFSLAEALRVRPAFFNHFVETVPVDPLCESYPKVAAIKSIVGCPKAAQVLHEPLLPMLTDLAVQRLPNLVQKQITLTLEILRKFGLERAEPHCLSAASTTWKWASSRDDATTWKWCSSRDDVTSSFEDGSKFGSMAVRGQLSVSLFAESSIQNTLTKSDALGATMPPGVAKLCAIADCLWE